MTRRSWTRTNGRLYAELSICADMCSIPRVASVASVERG